MKNRHSSGIKVKWRGGKPITIQELIVKSNFNTMMNIIIDFDPKMENQAPHFFRAYEYIKHMKVRYDEDYYLAENSEGKPFIMALEGTGWRNCLGNTIKMAKDLHCTDTELAAHCLWHLTFYGYTPEEQRAKADRENEELEREMRNDELCLLDEIYTDEEIKRFALSGYSRVRDEVLERLFTPEEIVEIKKRRKARVEEENARKDAAEEEERKQLEQEAALKMELKRRAKEEKRRERNRRRRIRKRNKHKKSN